MAKFELKVPDKLYPIFTQDYVFCILYGGRSSAKTGSIIRLLGVKGMEKRVNILCVREFQASIESSVYKEFKDYIQKNNLENYYRIKHDKIVGHNGTEIIFRGIQRDPMGLKGIPNLDYCFVEEAETITEDSWDILLPTLYKTDSIKILVAFNPRDEGSYTYKMLITNSEHLPQPVLKIEVNYNDNPYLSSVTRNAIEKLKLFDYAKYEHIYLGKPLNLSETVIFKGCFEIKTIDTTPLMPVRYGMDFGFNPDPFAFVKIVMLDKDTIYIEKEIYINNLLPSKIKSILERYVPEAISTQFYADSSRNDTIAELQQMGLRVRPCVKGKGSIESGIEYIKGKKIFINPKCKNMIFEAYNYKLEQTRDGTILPIPIDKHNHLWDACRYALNDEIGARRRRIYVSKELLERF